MRCIKIPLIQTGQIHKLSSDYLSGNPEINQFFDFEPSITGTEKAIEARKKYPVNRTVLVDALTKQYIKTDPDYFENSSNNLVIDNVKSLSNKNTFTVTTGHQLNIFTGPLYYIYKLISVIKYAETLNQTFPDFHFVPVYWMATEDHDFEEINHFHLWGKTFTWEEKSSGAVGRINPHSLNTIIEEISSKTGNNINGETLISIFRKSYLEHNSLADAVRYLVNKLFKNQGLVILDGDDSDLKKTLIPIFEKDIFQNSFYKTVNSTCSVLEKHYKLPVSPREINVFYLGDKSRTRIVFENGKYHAQETSKRWTETELKQELNINPEYFSPNVVLRPVYQELTLPNIAYIGGNNEIAYWLQLKSAFNKAKVFFPQLLVRDSALYIGKKANAYLEMFKLEPQDLLQSAEDLNFKFYQVNALEHASEKDCALILDQYEKLRNDLQGLPNDLVATIVKQMNLQIKEVRRWKNEIHNKQLELQEVNITKLDKIYRTFYPDGEFQERHDNFIPYYLQYGDEWFEILKNEFNVLEAMCHIFVEEENN